MDVVTKRFTTEQIYLDLFPVFNIPTSSVSYITVICTLAVAIYTTHFVSGNLFSAAEVTQFP